MNQEKNRNQKKNKKKWKIILPIAVILVIVLAVAGRGRKTQDTALEVETAKVTKADIKAVLETGGTIGSEDVRSYSSPVSAKISQMNVQVGDTVKKGDYLLTFDTASLEKSYNISELQSKAENAANEKSLEMSAKGSAQAAEANAQISSLQSQIADVNRQIADINKQIKKQEQKQGQKQKEAQGKAVSSEASGESAKETARLASQLEKAQASLESLQNSLAEAQAKKEEGEAMVLTEAEKQEIQASSQAAKLTLSQSADALSTARAGITAEFDGIVTASEVTAGTVAQEGMDLISVADASKMCVDFQLSKYNLKNIKEGQKVVITSLDQEYQGSVISVGKVARTTEEGAAMAQGRVRIDNPDEGLIIGLDAGLKIELGSKKDVLTVPIAAVNSDTKGDFVYVLEKGKVKKKYVTTGIASQKQIELVEGLKEGEVVITTVDSDLEEGMEAVTKKSGKEE